MAAVAEFGSLGGRAEERVNDSIDNFEELCSRNFSALLRRGFHQYFAAQRDESHFVLSDGDIKIGLHHDMADDSLWADVGPDVVGFMRNRWPLSEVSRVIGDQPIQDGSQSNPSMSKQARIAVVEKWLVQVDQFCETNLSSIKAEVAKRKEKFGLWHK